MFSILSQGYGTYDGTAKKDVPEIPETKDYFTLDDLRLPPIGTSYRAPATVEVSDYCSGPRYENKPFTLPKVEKNRQHAIHVPKTYTTRKGALLLYAEDYCLPGSPKPRKKRRKIKRPTALNLRTMNDLRNYILDYKNGGDPLFLALLEKRLSGYRDSVRPGFSPKRYIANLGNSLQGDIWKRLTAAGSIKDPTLQSYDPGNGNGRTNSLKPQPYATMSLPPLSPSSSMFDSSFHFYKNGMSTGAASMITLNSESEEYAPSSRALSPTESLSDRLSEVELLPQRKDPYRQLNAKEKEALLSQLLVERTLKSNIMDLQEWVTNHPSQGGGVEQDATPTLTLPKSKAKHRGSLKSGSLTSIPRLPPIQSAGFRPTTPVEIFEDRTLPQELSGITAYEQSDDYSGKSEANNETLDPGSVHLDLNYVDDSSMLADWHEPRGNETIAMSDDASSIEEDDRKSEDSAQKMTLPFNEDTSKEGMEPFGVDGSEGASLEDHRDTEDSVEDGRQTHNDEVVALDDIVLSDNSNTVQPNGRLVNLDDTVKGIEAENQPLERQELSSRENEQSEGVAEVESAKDALHEQGSLQAEHEGGVIEGEHKENRDMRSDGEDEGIGLERDEHVSDSQEMEEVNKADEIAASDKGSHSSEPVEPPPPISLEELQGEAQIVANRVLSRPQSGMEFMEDARTAIAMWADRLTKLLGPLTPDARISSAKQRPSLVPQVAISRPTRHRKVSRSAGLPVPALKKALIISGGDMPEIEGFKNLPPLPGKFTKPVVPDQDSGQSRGPSKHGSVKGRSASTKASASSAAARSIPWERISNSDVQVDLFSFATVEPTLQRTQADEIVDDDSDEDDKQFKTALNAVVTEVKPEYTLIEAQSRMAVASPKKDQPFKFPRPLPAKPPAGLKNKQPPGEAKEKAKRAPLKKATPAKKKGGKKPGKQTKPNKAGKITKGKAQASKKEDKVSEVKEKNVKEEKNVEEVTEEKTEVARVDSETGEQVPEILDETAVSPALSRHTSPRVSSKASNELNESKNADSLEGSLSVPELPRLVPKPPEPQVSPPPDTCVAQPPEPETAQPSPVEEQKPPQESKAARRAAERAAAAERRRQEVERKRREREEAKRKALEEEARLERVRLEAEEEMRRREEERRLRKKEKEDAKQREVDDDLERQRQAKAKAERERRAREEWKRRQQQVMAQRKLEEELRREQEKIDAELEAARIREEEERIKAMEESERIAFLEKMRLEEEELRLRLEEQKRIEEEERELREEEKKQREEALALLRQKQLQRHLFVAGMLKESQYLALSQRLTRAFTFSYFDLLPWNDLNHLIPPPSPVRDLLDSVKENIPPTILEEDENDDEE
ncbi:uncharacterized protein KIAA2012-like [Montipora capricornis]|uniref:uncharacterized protein KIAA2012-like n=1 Tax=Montipora capricornis TaxID=246305 RepID=UPI0035F1214E